MQHTPKMYTATLLNIYIQCLYVNNGAFPFDTRKNTIQGMELIYHHFARFGLDMHIRRNGVASKTECVFFPTHQFIKEKLKEHQATIMIQMEYTPPITETTTTVIGLIKSMICLDHNCFTKTNDHNSHIRSRKQDDFKGHQISSCHDPVVRSFKGNFKVI